VCHAQVDVGFGDAVTPGPDRVTFPVTLPGFPAPELGAYPRYSVVSEKLEAIVSFGMANSRLKDYFDLWILATHSDFDGPTLTRAIDATFQRCLTPLPTGMPIGPTPRFAGDPQKHQQWTAFARRNRLEAPPLTEVVHLLGLFLAPTLTAARTHEESPRTWRDGSWHA
jgi:hypothetical protein